MNGLRRLAVIGAALAAMSNVAFGYYHWTYFVSRTGPYTPIRKKFDLNAFPGGVVPFFIARQGPSKLVDGDTFAALVTQIRRAGESWNVTGPAIKTQFAGFTDTTDLNAITEQATPGIDVEFDDNLQPGVLAQTSTNTYLDLHYLGAKGAPSFAPILRSRVQLASDLTVRAQASYSDTFFTTIVHEFGHALGLQHSLTNAAMSTLMIRSNTKAQPITPDDVAGLALLYPTTDFLAQTGSITGHVSVGGNDGNLVSVVALRFSDGLVVGSMTQPDGFYRIDGLPPGDYIVYAHPLPPIQPDGGDAAALVAPTDLDNAPFLATANFQTRFAGAGGTVTKDWSTAAHFLVQAGKLTAAHADFSLDRVSSPGPYNINMWGFVGSTGTTVVGAPLPSGYKNWMALYGQNVITGPSKMVSGLQISAIGSAATLNQTSLQIYDPFSQYLPIIVATANPVDRASQVAVTFSIGDALYVSPRAFSVVPSQHPRITSITQGTDSDGQAVALIAGENMDRNKVLFDGAEAQRVVKKADGTLEALPPPATSGYSAVVELLGPDGQTSWQIQQYDPGFPTIKYTYPAAGPNSYALGNGSILAGTDQMIELFGAGTNFVNGRTEVGFGTSDVVVRQLWVTAPDHILMNVSANPKAKLGNMPLTISTDLQTVTNGIALQVAPGSNNQISMLAPVVNDATGLAGVPAAGTIAIRASGLPASTSGWLAIIGGSYRDVSRGADGVLRVAVPGNLPVGPTQLQMQTATGDSVPSVLFQVDAGPPVIQSVTKVSAPAATTVYVLDQISLRVAGLGAGEYIDPASIQIRVAGVLQTVDSITWDKDAALYTIQFTLSDTVAPGDALPVTLQSGTRLSPAAVLNVGAVRPAGL